MSTYIEKVCGSQLDEAFPFLIHETEVLVESLSVFWGSMLLVGDGKANIFKALE